MAFLHCLAALMAGWEHLGGLSGTILLSLVLVTRSGFTSRRALIFRIRILCEAGAGLMDDHGHRVG